MTPTELLQPFCSTDPNRRRLLRPFLQHEHLVGTDGRILIAIPGAEGDPSAAPDIYPVLLSIRAALAKPAVALPALPTEHLTVPCKECGGAGHFKKCPECDGEGTTECCECGQDQVCPACKGKGILANATGGQPCDFCSGEGSFITATFLPIGDAHYSDLLLQKLLEHLDIQSFHPSGPDVAGFVGTFRAAPHITYLGGIMPTRAP